MEAMKLWRNILVMTAVILSLVLLRQPIAPMESDGMSRFFSRTPRNVTKPLNICSDFHLGRHFFGLVGGFFVGLSVTLWLGMTLGGGYSMT